MRDKRKLDQINEDVRLRVGSCLWVGRLSSYNFRVEYYITPNNQGVFVETVNGVINQVVIRQEGEWQYNPYHVYYLDIEGAPLTVK